MERTTPGARDTLMFAEAAEAPEAVRRLAAGGLAAVERISARLRAERPRSVITCARGSSDHAAVYARYLIETKLGIMTSPAALSVRSVYRTPIDSRGAVCLAISQSGASPDIIAGVEAAKAAGALTIAIVNNEQSPLVALADVTLPLCAGPEQSVAATKSFITAIAAIFQLVAHWSEDAEMLAAAGALPEALDAAWALDWSAGAEALIGARNMFVIGRGPGYAAAREAALKFKETCGIHAEAYSAAEVLHGPAALVKDGFPILAFAQGDETHAGASATISELVRRGGRVIVAGANVKGALRLPTIAAHPALEPLLMTQSFYRMANLLSVRRGYNPDSPPNTLKITETV